MYQSHNDWLVVLRNTSKLQQVWGCIGELLQRKGSYLPISENLYRAVVKALLIFGAKTWVLSAAMAKKL